MTYTENGIAALARFVYDSAGNVRGFILNDSAVYMYLKNAQGDVRAVVDESGAIVIRYTYNAWGKTEFAVPSGVDPADTSIISKVSPFCYRGYCYDFDIGLYYLQSRYYDPKLCRFINADSTDYLGATGTPLSYNLFAYCENDPVNNVDPKGCYYSNKKAVEYAKKWWNARNIDFYSYSTGGDCANFVSQCLYAGGYKMQYGVWSSQVSSKSKSGWDRQYRLAYYSYSSYYGNYIPIYKNYWYKVTYKWRSAPGLFDYLKNNKKLTTYKFTSQLRFKEYIKQYKIKVGDVAFFATSKKGIYHAVIIGKIRRTNGYDAYYYAHSSNRNAEIGYNRDKYDLLSGINESDGKYIYVVSMR